MDQRGKQNISRACIAIVVGTIMGLVLCETAYRILLYTQATERFSPSKSVIAEAFDRPPFLYDAAFGYSHPANVSYTRTRLTDGIVTSCETATTNSSGNVIAPKEPSVAEGTLRIAIFGDSWTDATSGGMAWPDFLRDHLAQRGITAKVENYGRGAYGILQMFDLAGAVVPATKPDLAIIAFITDDLMRARTWRTVVYGRDGPAVVASPDPSPAAPLERQRTTHIVVPEASSEWCSSMLGTGRQDEVTQRIQSRYSRAAVKSEITADIFTLRHSYLWPRIWRGDPFRGLLNTYRLPKIQLHSYGADDEIMNAIAALKASGVPIVLVHFAIYPELRANQEYIVTNDQSRLIQSLTDVTGWPILETLAYAQRPLPDLDTIIESPTDYHPSRIGMDFYGQTVARMVLGKLSAGTARPE